MMKYWRGKSLPLEVKEKTRQGTEIASDKQELA